MFGIGSVYEAFPVPRPPKAPALLTRQGGGWDFVENTHDPFEHHMNTHDPFEHHTTKPAKARAKAADQSPECTTGVSGFLCEN